MSERCASKKIFCQFHGTKTVTVWRICTYIEAIYVYACAGYKDASSSSSLVKRRISLN